MNLKLVFIASVSVSLAAAAGCVGAPSDTILTGAGGSGSGAGPGPGPGPGPVTSSGTGTNATPAHKYYVANVHPLLTAGAQPCATCHASGMLSAPVFMDADAELAYSKLEAFPGLITAPENSLLILHGLHTGPAMSTPQRDATAQWLIMEAQERGLGMGSGSSSAASSSSSSASSSSSGGGGGKPTDLASALVMFGKCMDALDWANNGLKGLADVQTNGSGACNNCHNTGDGGNFLNSADDNTTFLMQKDFPYVKRWVSGTYDMDGNFTGLKAVPRQYLKAQEAALCNAAKEPCHPKYTMSDTLKAGVDKFIASTLNKMENNLCPP